MCGVKSGGGSVDLVGRATLWGFQRARMAIEEAKDDTAIMTTYWLRR